MKKLLTGIITGVLLAGCLTATGCDEHTFSADWSTDDSYHWHACLDEGCKEVSDKAEHVFELSGTINSCKTCDYSFDTSSTYEVNVMTLGNTAIQAVDVKLFDEDNREVATVKTNVRGKARFRDVPPGNYTAKIVTSTLPKGYKIENSQNNVALSAQSKSAILQVPSSVITDEEMPAGHKYKLGDVVYDFTTTAVGAEGSNKPISLSAYLSAYKVVVLNFWFANCSPCLSEFPHMNDAYIDYKDQVALIAIDNGSDSAADVNAFVGRTGYKFDFVNDESMFSYYSAYGANAFPTTVVIDRYGAVSAIDSGSRPSISAWTNLFDYYLSDDYVPDYTTNNTGDDKPSTDTELAKPNVEMPTSAEIANALTQTNDYTTKTTFTYSEYTTDEGKDEYSWPFVLAEKDGFACVKTSNAQRVNSYSILVIDVQMTAGQQLFFDYFVSTELETDLLYIQVDEVLQYALSGEDSVWNTDKLLYIARRDGAYRITLTYQKSAMTNAGEDTVYIKNLRLEEGTPIEEHYDLLYNAVDNYTLDEGVTVPEPYKGFINHVAYYLDEGDGFYHVALSGDPDDRSENDPILLADLYYSTPWNNNSVWLLAYTETGLFNPNRATYKEGYYEAIEDYSWLQQNSPSRYVPLTKELQKILADVVTDEDCGRNDHSQDPFNGTDMWLELCRYFVHYGQAETSKACFATDNTVTALNWRVAEDYGTVGTENVAGNEKVIHVDVYSLHLPRGNYYKFVPTTSGAYLIRSMAPNVSDFDLKANENNPLGFLCNDKGEIIDENDDFNIEIQGYDKDNYPLYDNNFYIYAYLEANKTYYVGGCFNDPYTMGKYDVQISYLGDSYRYFTSCAYDTTYTYDEDDPYFMPYVPTKMGKNRYFLGEDDIYYAQEKDGSQGSQIYIRLVGVSFFNGYSEYTLEQLIENDLIGNTLEEKLYLRDMLIASRKVEGELHGYAPATKKLVAIINAMANGSETSDSTTYSSTSWLLAAYYYKNVNAVNAQN